ncbi:MAG: TonB-dependent receptor [Bryobacteraceae bacterium]
MCERVRLLSLLLLCAPSLSGQAVSATLVGTVTDASGGVVADAKVTLVETNTDVEQTRNTNTSGNYTFPFVPPGHYTVTAESSGFRRETRSGIDLTVDTETRVDLQLQPGNVSETVAVSATTPLLQADRADISSSIAAVQVQDLPLGVNRNYQSLLDLVPGTTPATFDHSQFYNAASSLQTESNGQMRQANNYQIEGVDNNERARNLQVLVPPAEAIQVVDISTSNHDSELGFGGGAVTNVILKSGTNSYHGSAYEFLQNSAMNARAFFNPSVGHLAYNYVGASIGGPIKRNKIFFFLDYLRSMDHEANTNLVTIPSAAFRSGNLSAATTTIYNPFTGNADGSGRTAFPNNQIPNTLINPVSAKLLALLPATNEPFNQASPSNNYYALLPFQKTTDSFDVKVDDNITSNDRLSVRLSYARPSVFQAPIFGDAGGPAQGAFEGTGLQRGYSGGFNYSRIISSTLITEVRAGVAYYHNDAHPSDFGKDDAAAIGIPGVNIGTFESGMVGINITGFSSPLTGYSASIPWDRSEANIDLSNIWTKIAGNHTIKFGVDLRRLRDNIEQDQAFSPRGVYYFGVNQTSIAGQPTGVGNDFASFLLDQPDEVGRDVNTYFPGMRLWEFSGFVSDGWQVSPRLTLSLGLRWELFPPAVEPYPAGFSNYNPVNNTLVLGGIGGNPANGGVQTKYTNFSPRLGIAYRVSSSTVVRSGFGISYTPPCTDTNCQEWNFPVEANNEYLPANNSPYLPALLPSGQVATFQLGMPAPQPIVIPSNGIITNPSRTSTYTVTPVNFPISYVEAWNFAVEQALPFRFTIDAAYVGSHGVDVHASPNINAGQIIGAGALGQPEYPRTVASTLWSQGFSSSYNALQVKLDRRFASSLGITTAFTWQKAMNYQSSDDGGLDFYMDQQRNYARADFDRTLNFIQSYIYNLPFGKSQRWLTTGPAAAVIGGWKLSGILSARTGTPLTFTGNGATLNLPGSVQTADQIAPVQILHGINTGNQWFSTSSFAEPVGARFGTSGRNIISGPGLFSLNASLFRQIDLTERYHLELRAEAFNLTNTPEFANPNTSLTSSSFGYVTGTLGSGTGINGVGGGRSLEMSVRLAF